jgi:catechol 2,3-dioxygenase-like lactoylglutathione lyase family enzyme
MKIKLSSIFVNDQQQALAFYTETLGFVKKYDIPMGNFRWLTVTSADEPDGTELVLEPNVNPISSAFQKGLFEQGIPATAFKVDDIQQEYERLKNLNVTFKIQPTNAGPIMMAVFNDTCGNNIQIYQVL